MYKLSVEKLHEILFEDAAISICQIINETCVENFDGEIIPCVCDAIDTLKSALKVELNSCNGGDWEEIDFSDVEEELAEIIEIFLKN